MALKKPKSQKVTNPRTVQSSVFSSVQCSVHSQMSPKPQGLHTVQFLKFIKSQISEETQGFTLAVATYPAEN